MGIFTLPAASTSAAPSLNWTLISTSTPNSVASLSLTSIPTTYSKLLITFSIDFPSNSNQTELTFNNDTDNKYSYSFQTWKSSTALAYTTSVFSNVIGIVPGGGGFNNSNSRFFIVIDNANTTGVKTFEGSTGNSAGFSGTVSGLYEASAAISRIDLVFPTTTNASENTVRLYGVSA